MAYTVNNLIADAYYASGLVAREFETVNGQKVTDGLLWLNDILTETNVNDTMIPYESTYDFNAVVGQEAYFIPNLVQIDTLVFYLDSVRYAMKYTKRNQYFGSSRVENIQSLPFQWYFEREKGGGSIYIYFEPDQTYPIQLHGSFELTKVALGDNLETTYDQFYITYLRYMLADRICSENNYVTPPNIIDKRDYYSGLISKQSKVLDLRIKKTSTLQKRGTLGWAFVNLGRGWTASY